MKSIALIFLCLLLTGCGPKPDTFLRIESSTYQSRFTVTRVGVIHDDLAYDERRGIYLIVDTKTGTEYVGVSGVGISETGSHRAGKANVADER